MDWGAICYGLGESLVVPCCSAVVAYVFIEAAVEDVLWFAGSAACSNLAGWLRLAFVIYISAVATSTLVGMYTNAAMALFFTVGAIFTVGGISHGWCYCIRLRQWCDIRRRQMNCLFTVGATLLFPLILFYSNPASLLLFFCGGLAYHLDDFITSGVMESALTWII